MINELVLGYLYSQATTNLPLTLYCEMQGLTIVGLVVSILHSTRLSHRQQVATPIRVVHFEVYMFGYYVALSGAYYLC